MCDKLICGRYKLMIVSIDAVSIYPLIKIILVKLLLIIYKRLSNKYDKEDRHVLETYQSRYYINPTEV